MKKILSFLFLSVAANAIAQPTIQTPGTHDNIWYSASEKFNTSMISYGSGGLIFVSTYNGSGGGAAPLFINDPGISSGTISPTSGPGGPYPPSAYLMPDVIIGNDTRSFHYLVGVSYTNGGQVNVDVYDLYDDGIATVTCSLRNTIGPINPPFLSHANISHLDIIAESGNTAITGYPFCDKFVITWDDNNGTDKEVWAAYGSLNSGLLSPPMMIASPTMPFSNGGKTPDVSAIQRNIAAPFTPPIIQDFALITYVDTSGDSLYLTEWNIAAPAPTATLMEHIPSVTQDLIMTPRIDAIDDYTVNNTPGLSEYKIAAQVDNGTNKEIRTYDNVLGPLSSFTNSAVIDITTAPSGFYISYPPPYDNYSPVVALAGAENYSVQHFMKYSAAKPHDILFMEPIDKTNPSAISSVPSNSYFWVNSLTGTPIDNAVTSTGTGHADYSNSISAPVNNCCSPNNTLLCAWGQKNPSTGLAETRYKLTGTSAYAFKPGTSAVATATRQRELKVYPNPALNELSIINPAGQDAATDYIVTDITGHNILHGSLQTGVSKVDLVKLVPGNYVLQTFKNGEDDGKMTFIKE